MIPFCVGSAARTARNESKYPLQICLNIYIDRSIHSDSIQTTKASRCEVKKKQQIITKITKYYLKKKKTIRIDYKNYNWIKYIVFEFSSTKKNR